MKKGKLKGSVKALNPIVIFMLFVIFTVVCVAIRSYQMMYIFEPDTGFYLMEEQGNFTIPLLYSIVFSSCLLLMLFSFLSGKLPKETPPVGKNAPFALVSGFFAVSLVADGITVFAELLDLYGEQNDRWMLTPFIQFLRESKSYPQMFEILFALLSALYFIITAVSYFTGTRTYAATRVLSLMPVCWLMCRLISRFVLAVSFINHSEIFWELIMICLLMIFFIGYARIMSGVNSEGRLALTMGTGLSAALIAFMIILSRAIAYLFAGPDYLSVDSTINICDIGAGLLVCVFLLSLIRESIEAEKEEESAAGAPSAAGPAAPGAVTVSPLPSNDEEAFRIAEQYASPYVSVDSIAAVSDLFTAPSAAQPPMQSSVPPMQNFVPPMQSSVPPVQNFVPPVQSPVPPVQPPVPPQDGQPDAPSENT